MQRSLVLVQYHQWPPGSCQSSHTSFRETTSITTTDERLTIDNDSTSPLTPPPSPPPPPHTHSLHLSPNVSHCCLFSGPGATQRPSSPTITASWHCRLSRPPTVEPPPPSPSLLVLRPTEQSWTLVMLQPSWNPCILLGGQRQSSHGLVDMCSCSCSHQHTWDFCLTLRSVAGVAVGTCWLTCKCHTRKRGKLQDVLDEAPASLHLWEEEEGEEEEAQPTYFVAWELGWTCFPHTHTHTVGCVWWTLQRRLVATVEPKTQITQTGEKDGV